MIWIILTALLYAIISGAALFIICSEEPAERREDAYWDVRHIIAALLWWLILLWSGLAWLFAKTLKSNKNGTADKQ